MSRKYIPPVVIETVRDKYQVTYRDGKVQVVNTIDEAIKIYDEEKLKENNK